MSLENSNHFVQSGSDIRNRVKVFVGRSCWHIGNLICDYLQIPQASSNLTFFSNGETRVELMESVRGQDVYLLQTGSTPVNDNIMELLVMIHSCKYASAARITAVVPCYPYARQDKKDRGRAPITAKLLADMLKIAGADHAIVMDLHANQIQGFFDIPVDNLSAEPLIIEWIKENIKDYKSSVCVSPDAGGAKRVTSLADRLKIEFAIIHKERKKPNEVSSMIIVGDVKDKNVIIVDDMADTCGTIVQAATKLREVGACRITAICVHGIFSGNPIEKLKNSQLDNFVVTNTLPLSDEILAWDKLKVIDVSPMIGESIRRTHMNESVSFLFHNAPNGKLL